MTRAFEIRSGRRVVAVLRSVSPLQAAVDYVRGLGSSEHEIVRLGRDSVSWRGARFSATPVGSDDDVRRP
jgi:hypothetical protein